MEAIVIKRLETIGNKVREGIGSCEGFADFSKDDSGELNKVHRVVIEKLRLSVDRLRGEIRSCVGTQTVATPDLETKVEELTNLQIKAEDLLIEIDTHFSSTQDKATTSYSVPVNESVNTRLPKLEMKKYDGNILRWHEFWDQFSSIIEKRNQMSDVDKLSYLSNLVEGDAKRAIEGLDITNANYKVAVDRLTERFGKKGSLIDAHYTALQLIPKATRDVNSCRRTLDEIERHLRTLYSLGENTEHKQLRATILEKFPDETMFDLRMAMTSDDHSVAEIRTLLEKVISAREAVHRMAIMNKVEKTDTNDSQPNYTIEALYASIKDLKHQFTISQPTTSGISLRKPLQARKKNSRNNNLVCQQLVKRDSKKDNRKDPTKRRKLQCIFCTGPHIHEKCDKFETAAKRKAQLGNRCYLCLRDTHFASECPNRANIKCPHCNKQGSHNRSLCPVLDNTKKYDDKTRTNTLFSLIKCDSILQTAIAQIETTEGRSIDIRVLLDTGSQKTYIRKEVAKKLKLRIIESTGLTIFTFGSSKPITMATTVVSFKIQTRVKRVEIQAYTIPTLTGVIPSHHTLRESLRNLYPSLNIAKDVSSDCAADVIIGNDFYHTIIEGERLEVTPTLLLLKSVIGWIPSGTYNIGEFQYNTLSVLTYFQYNPTHLGKKFYSLPDPAIKDDHIKDIWELETIGIRDSPKVLADDEVVQFFNKTTVFENGRYYVKWPWTQYPPDLPVNFGLALGRLKSLITRTDDDTLKIYNDVIQDQLNKGIVEIITESRLPDTHPVHYLPHHGVLQPHKTTKLRIVYDGSAKTKGQLSLNEYLYKGPLLLEDMTALLVRFRQYPIGIIADIEKAFLQIGLQTPDRDVTRFLWIRNVQEKPSEDNLVHLRFCRVPFGIISSPFLLAATIRKHLLHTNDAMTKKVANCLYVDNLVTGVNTTEEAMSLFQKTRISFAELSMNIREWNSNSHSFRNSLPQEVKDDSKMVSVLGLKWDTAKDTISLTTQRNTIERPISTKREILRVIASVFDPCGFSAPLTLPARLLLQDMWNEKIKWDTPLPQNFCERWEHCKTFLKGIPAVSLPRYHFEGMILVPQDWSYELHCFTDASKDAYVAAVYLRASTGNHHLSSLMISRSRLTRIKRKESLTIPKLELLAVVIGTRLLDYVLSRMELPINSSFLWTDSQVVLGWLRSDRLLPPFVARRIAEVKNAETIQFRYVRSALNPADVATRQIVGNTLPRLWTNGPDFLKMPSDDWPMIEYLGHCTPTPEERGQSEVALLNSTLHTVNNHSSDYTLPAEGIIIPTSQMIAIQNEYYPKEQQAKLTPLAKSLGLYRDEMGILRCKGRFANAAFPIEQKYPILLPKLAPITSEIIRRIHETHHHVGVLHTLSLLRQTYWVPQGRSLVAKVLHRCLKCVKYGGGPYQLPEMPPLPFERVTFSPPFTNTGLDYFGPFTTVMNDVQHKRWACLFTCMAVRAVHIELVDDCSTKEFLLAFRRFCANRGVPRLVVSDNAAHFKLAASIFGTSMGKAPTTQTQWRFIPALSPWFGGFYERLVGLVKNCLRRTLDQSLLTDGQLRTVLYEIASTLNSRPLTAVSSDNDIVLTPSHFLSTCGPTIIHLDDLETAADPSRVREHLVSGWKKTDALLRQFGVMFQTHYLSSLRERHQLQHKQSRIMSGRVPKVGDQVQIKGDSKNRVHWTVGKIAALLPSSDGAVRTARVMLRDGGIINRSIAHLYPLEMDIVDLPPGPQDAATCRPTVTPNSSDNPTQEYPPSLSDSQTQPSLGSEVPSQQDGGNRPTRAAARRAVERIRTWTRAMFAAACAAVVPP